MDASDANNQSRRPSLFLALLGLVLAGGMSVLFFKDVRKTLRSSSDKPTGAEAIAIDALSKLTAENGWFEFVRNPIYDFQDSAQGWTLQDEIGIPDGISRTEEKPVTKTAATVGVLELAETNLEGFGRALAVPVNFPDPVTIIRETNRGPDDPQKLLGVRFLSYDVFVPRECPGFASSILFLKDKDGLWYQSRSRAALIPGRWTTVTADLRGSSPDITPLGHHGQWDDNQATRVRSVGITVYGDTPYTGKVLVDNLRGWTRHDRLKSVLNAAASNPASAPDADRVARLQSMLPIAEQFQDGALKAFNFRTDPAAEPISAAGTTSPPSVLRYDTFTVRFELNRAVDNPFDPEKADVTCTVVAPSGETKEHIGFWFQDYDRTDRFQTDQLNPIGRPEWRVRICPRETGEYKYTVKARIKKSGAAGGMDEITLPTRTFTSLPTETRGFIRVSQKDPRYFEHETGQFYYPHGHNISTPVDVRCWREIFKEEPPGGRGLPMYQDYFAKMQANGANICEVWMASWWLGIEWTQKWPNFYGAGRYSLQNAWKMDYTLEMARKHGIYIHMVFDNHGKFSAWCDWEWELNPYNSLNPYDRGTASTAEEMFTDEQARKWHRNKLRYIAARWGADPTVMGWELVSEYDLVGGQNVSDRQARNRFHRSPVLKAWAQEMIEHLNACDAYDHPVTVHYATDFTIVDTELVQKPFVDYVATDVYRPIARRYAQSAVMNQDWFKVALHAFGATKPFWITEYGGDFNAAPLTYLHADIECGMWSTWMTEGAGTPLFWWYDVIDRLDTYSYYGAFAKYVKGEDRRGLKGMTQAMQITAAGNVSAGQALLGQMYRWETGAYGWVYNDKMMQSMPVDVASRSTHDGVEAIIAGLTPDTYRVEFWDCYTGAVVKSEDIVVSATQPLLMKFPTFRSNMAFKVKSSTRAKELPTPALTSPTANPAATPPAPPVSRKKKFITGEPKTED